MMSFDLNADDIVREDNRIQIRVVLSGDRLRGLLASTEVFENDTGKTTVFSAVPTHNSEIDAACFSHTPRLIDARRLQIFRS